MAVKAIEEKLQSVLKAWETLRPTKKFAGMTHAEFLAKVQPSLSTRAELVKLETQITAQSDLRDKADVVSNTQMALVVNSVKGDPDEGEDGELYEAMGYVRKSERKTGLTRKMKKASAEKQP